MMLDMNHMFFKHLILVFFYYFQSTRVGVLHRIKSAYTQTEPRRVLWETLK